MYLFSSSPTKLKNRWGPWPASIYEGLENEDVATQRPVGAIDDIYIAVVVGYIDGKGKRFAEAGPTLVENGDRILAGSIKIEADDIPTILEKDIFLPLMLHEIAHVLGLGTLWKDGVQIDGTTYIGENALEAWREMGCTGDLPLESKEEKTHWKEECLVTEVFTPKLQFNRAAHISSVTLGALEGMYCPIDFDLIAKLTCCSSQCSF